VWRRTVERKAAGSVSGANLSDLFLMREPMNQVIVKVTGDDPGSGKAIVVYSQAV
jgi:hypothetical protein